MDSIDTHAIYIVSALPSTKFLSNHSWNRKNATYNLPTHGL